MAQAGGPVHLSWEDKTSQRKEKEMDPKRAFRGPLQDTGGSGSHTWKAQRDKSTSAKGQVPHEEGARGCPCSRSFLTCSSGSFWLTSFPSWALLLPSFLHFPLLLSFYFPQCFSISLLSLIGPIQQLLFFFSLELCCFLSVKKKKKKKFTAGSISLV